MEEHESSLHRVKSTTPGALNLLYSLFFLLYRLFQMSDQVSASGNLDLWTAGACSTNDYDTLSHAIMRTACIAATRANLSWFCSYYTPYFTIISIICTIIRIISKLEILIWVHIHCRKLSSRHILAWRSVSKQIHEQERLKHQEPKDPGQWRVLHQLVHPDMPYGCTPSSQRA